MKKEEERKKKPQHENTRIANVMVALLNIGDALCATPQSLADA